MCIWYSCHLHVLRYLTQLCLIDFSEIISYFYLRLFPLFLFSFLLLFDFPLSSHLPFKITFMAGTVKSGLCHPLGPKLLIDINQMWHKPKHLIWRSVCSKQTINSKWRVMLIGFISWEEAVSLIFISNCFMSFVKTGLSDRFFEDLKINKSLENLLLDWGYLFLGFDDNLTV